MVRIVAFALNAHEHLEMTKGLSTDDGPDIRQKSLDNSHIVAGNLNAPKGRLRGEDSD